jgi:hypothetical protein
MRSSRAVSSSVSAPSRAQGRIFAERMAGDEDGVARDVEPGFAFEGAKRGETRRHQRRLRVGGQRQLGLGPLEDHLRQRFAERRVDLLEHGARGGKRLGERFAHADRLRALPRKRQGRRHAILQKPRAERHAPGELSRAASIH